MIILEILNDFALLFKLIFFFIYSTLKLWISNLIIPSKFLYKNVDSEIVLITGAASGLGKALAIRFLKLNAIVIVVDINNFELKNTCTQLEDELNVLDKNGKRFYSYVCDVASYEQVKLLAKKIKNDVGNITILVNNAGIVNGDLLTGLSEKQIKRTFDVNVLSHFWTCKTFLDTMIASNKGHIICISSVMGFMGGYKLTDYCSSKFAAYGLTEALRVELKTKNPENNIKISIVCPFHIQTNMFRGVKFTNLNWLKISMTVDYAADCIIHGILLEKDIIYVPKLLPNICHIVKGLNFTKFNDHTVVTLCANAMDKLN